MTSQPRTAGVETPGPDAGEPALVELIREEIERAGPIPFARFMAHALYEPGLGYYATSADRPTRAGDFLTAPELHPIFGWTVANQIQEMWQRLGEPHHFTLREFGAGNGSLGDAIRDGLRRAGSRLAKSLRYEPLELPGRLREVPRAGPMIGCVLGNEFLDALPVHRLIKRDGRLQELLVGWDGGRFAEVPGDLSDERLIAAAGDVEELADGQQIEVNLSMTEWLAIVAEALERGYVLLFDYGLPRAELRSPSRQSGTVRAFRGQHVSSDVLGGVGQQDITAHVDLDALDADTRAAGLDVIGTTTQAEFLMGAGLDDVFAAAREEADSDWQTALDLRAAVRRLLDPQHLGRYAAVVLGKDMPREPPLRGFGYRLAPPG